MQERGQDDQDQPEYEPTRSRSNQPQWGTQQPDWAQQPAAPQYGEQTQPGWQPPAQAPKKKGSTALGLGCLGVLAAVVIIVVAVAVGGSKNNDAGSNAPAATTTTQGAADPSTTEAVAAAPVTSQAPSYVAQVVFSCTGSAPDGVDITYGTDSSNASASSLPFRKVTPITAGAQYFDVQAQLSGSGHVTCTTEVDHDGVSAVKTGTAEGGYNLATAEICSTFSGGWESC